MKVLDIYGKKDLDILTVKEIAMSKIMNNSFKKFPSSYRENYDKNLDTLELWKVDEHYEEALAEYSDIHNLIIFRDNSAVIHELMHMAASDYKTKKNGFVKSERDSLFESALLEGCTEYLAADALNSEATDYYFEVFVASMLSDIDGFFEPYFIPSYDKLISLFPRKKDILSLMYALSFYADNFDSVDMLEGDDKDILVTQLQHSIGDVIDSLIDIHLSINKDTSVDSLYGDKFLSLLEGKKLCGYLREVWKDYLEYANDQVKTRVLRRD